MSVGLISAKLRALVSVKAANDNAVRFVLPPPVVMRMAIGGVLLLSCVGSVGSPAHAQDIRQETLAALQNFEKTGRLSNLTFDSATGFVRAMDSVAATWVSQAPAPVRERRRAIVALFVLEVAVNPANGGQIQLIEWACQFLRRQNPSEFERLWQQASVATLQQGYFQTTGTLLANALPHLDHAFRRFQADPRLRLMNLSLRPEVFRLSSRPGADARRLVKSVVSRPSDLGPSTKRIDVTLGELLSLGHDPEVGPESQVRAAWIYFHQNKLSDCIATAQLGLARTDDPFVKYLGYLVLGLAHDHQRNSDQAQTAYRSAAAALPGTSGALALSASLFLAGDREAAADVVNALSEINNRADPWTHVVSDYRRLTADIGRLRSLVQVPIDGVPALPPDNFGLPAAVSGGRALPPQLREEQRTSALFRAVRSAVAVDVSVMRGNQPVSGLTISDFEVTDQGVPQVIETVATTNELSIDVSLVVVTTDWSAPLKTKILNQLALFSGDIEAIVRALRAGDRLQVITVSGSTARLVPFTSAEKIKGAELPTMETVRKNSAPSFGRNYALYDALTATLVQHTSPDRRHIVAVFGSGYDDASITTADQLLRIARQVDPVLYFARRDSQEDVVREGLIKNGMSLAGVRPFSETMLWPNTPDVIQEVAAETGGSTLFRGSGSMADDFIELLKEYRQSYVLRYQPQGVDAGGWHPITVRVKSPGNVEVRARKGYFGG